MTLSLWLSESSKICFHITAGNVVVITAMVVAIGVNVMADIRYVRLGQYTHYECVVLDSTECGEILYLHILAEPDNGLHRQWVHASIVAREVPPNEAVESVLGVDPDQVTADYHNETKVNRRVA